MPCFFYLVDIRDDEFVIIVIDNYTLYIFIIHFTFCCLYLSQIRSETSWTYSDFVVAFAEKKFSQRKWCRNVRIVLLLPRLEKFDTV